LLTIQLIIVCATVLILAGIAAGTLKDTLARQSAEPEASDGVLAALEPFDKALVHIGDGQSVSGIVHTAESGVLTLTGGELLTGREKTSLPGVYHIPVSVIQGVETAPRAASACQLRAAPTEDVSASA